MECRMLFEGSGPLLGMLMVQLIATGLQILSKVILNQGTFIFALMSYRHILAAFCLAPFAFYLERGAGAKVTLKVVFWVFLSSLTGIIMGMGMFYYGLRDTTATYATNFLNLIPIVTFIFSILARMERLNLKSSRGKVRIAGTILCVTGALIISLYKGHVLHIRHHQPHHYTWLIVKEIKQHWTRGTILLVGSCLSYASWFIAQVKLLKLLPYKYWATMLTCLSAAIQAAVVGFCLDRRKSSWMLGWNLELITIVYSGVLASAVTFYLISVAISIKGPTYPAMFNPLALVFIALIEVLILGEDLSSGSIIGMVIIVVGLYSFLWASKRKKKGDVTLPKSAILERDSSIELGGSQMTATVVPTSSPVSHFDDEQPDIP